MSYSRWSNSNWYSFWNSMSGDTKEDQLLSLWYVGFDSIVDIPYDELVEINDPQQLSEYYSENIPLCDLEEAMQYIDWFIQDVNEDFDANKK